MAAGGPGVTIAMDPAPPALMPPACRRISNPSLTAQAFPAVFTIDTFGRRSLLLATFPNMCWTLLAGGMCFFIQDQSLRTTLVAVFVYIFTAFYSIGEGPVP